MEQVARGKVWARIVAKSVVQCIQIAGDLFLRIQVRPAAVYREGLYVIDHVDVREAAAADDVARPGRTIVVVPQALICTFAPVRRTYSSPTSNSNENDLRPLR